MYLYQPLHVLQGHYTHRTLNFTASYNYLIRCFEICDDLHVHRKTKGYITDCVYVYVCMFVCMYIYMCVCVCVCFLLLAGYTAITY